jgi:hypothetical protein
MLPRAAAINYPRAAQTPPPVQETRRVDGGHMFPLSITRPNVGRDFTRAYPT